MKSNTKIRGLTLCFFFILALSVLFFSGCTNKITQDSLIREMADRKHLTYFPEIPYKLKQFSSYNRESVGPDKEGWYANADMSYFLREEENEGRREFVMFDTDGPGAIVRWWMTFYKAQDGVIRLYLDHEPEPIIQGHPYEVLSRGTLAPAPFSVAVPDEAPEEERGNNLYVPIPFAKHCKITYENDILELKDGHLWPDVFYNICYREYEPGTRVESFSKEALTRAQQTLEKTKESLEDFQPPASYENELARDIAPGESSTLQFTEKGMAVSHLVLEISSSDLRQALRSTVLSVSFDGTQTVWVPVGEFFGTGYEMLDHETWMNRSTEDGLMESFWIMPFQETCSLNFHNYGDETVKIKVTAGLCSYQWKPESLYFGATWHEYHHIKTRSERGDFFDVNYVDIKGKGIYAGDQITLFNMADTWWGEGDEKIFVDGEYFPSSFGTGSEDYYGYAFGHPESFSHPFISQPTGSGNFNPGLTVNIRLRSLDAIPFTSSISSNIELWHWRATCIDYAMTAFYYTQASCSVNIKPDRESVRLPVAKSKDDFYSDKAGDTCLTIEQIKGKEKTIKVAMAQIFCLDGDRSGNFVRIENAVKEAKEKGAELVAFPETSVLGWVNPDAHDRAYPIPGPDSDRLCDLAEKYKVFISIGMAEIENEKLFDTHILIDDKGNILAKHRKINALTELMSPPYTKGSQIQAIDTRLGKIGLMICADTFKDELLLKMKEQTPDFVLVPYGWAAKEESWPDHGKELHKVVRHAAEIIGCPVIGTDLVGEITHGPWRGLTYGGQSIAVNQHAEILARCRDRDREIAVFEIKQGD